MADADLAANHGKSVFLVEKTNRTGGNTSSRVASNGMLVPDGSTVIGTQFKPHVHDYLTDDLRLKLNQHPAYPGIVVTNGKRLSFGPVKRQATPEPEKRLSFDPFTTYPSMEGEQFAQEILALAHNLRRALGYENGEAAVTLREKPHLLEWDHFSPNLFWKQYRPEVMGMIRPWMKSDSGRDYQDVSHLATMTDVASYLDIDQIAIPPGGNHYIVREIEKRLQPNPEVTLSTGTEIVSLKDTNKGQYPVQMEVRDAHGKRRTVHAKEAHLAVQIRQIPELLPNLPPAMRHTLSNAMKGGPYAIVGFVLNSEKKGVPLLSSKFYFLDTPKSKYVTDALLLNGDYDQNLAIGKKRPSVLICYAPIPESQWAKPPNEKAIVAQVLRDIKGSFPEVAQVGIRDIYVKNYPNGILAPRKGQVSEVCAIPEQLTPNIRAIGSTMSGLISSAALALDGPIRAWDLKEKEGRVKRPRRMPVSTPVR